MKLAITGGTGFIGSHLADRLENEGHQLVLLARSGREHSTQTASQTFTSSDLSDQALLQTSFAGCDAIAHCAGINREIGSQTFQRVHIEGTLNVVTAARAAGVKRIVLMSFLRARPN